MGFSNAAVVNFDDIFDFFSTDCTAVDIPDPYEGFFWDGDWVEVTTDLTYTACDNNNSYGSPSGENAVHNGWGKETITITPDGFNFNFKGAYFASWGCNDETCNFPFPNDDTSAEWIILVGYLDGQEVGYKKKKLKTNRYKWVNVNFKNIDELVIQSSGDKHFWLMDNFTYTIVP